METETPEWVKALPKIVDGRPPCSDYAWDKIHEIVRDFLIKQQSRTTGEKEK